jgi:hypothetical protein
VVPEASPIRLQCEIESFEDPIHGRVTGESGRVVAFRGWLELAAALSAAAAGTPPTTPPHQEHPHGHQ